MSPSALVSILPDSVDEAPTDTAMTPQQAPQRDAAPSLPGVLVLLPEGELRRRCLAVLTEGALAAPVARVWQSWADVPGDVTLDVFITSPDGPQASDHGASAG